MPILSSQLFPRDVDSQASDNNNNGKVQISGTALGFLIPIFALFILGPIAVVMFTRRRRARRAAAEGLPPVRPVPRTTGRITGRPRKISRETAIKALKGVTEVVTLQGYHGVRKKSEDEKVVHEDAGMGAAVGADDAGSVHEQECAICLSSLHAPSPPEPAQLPHTSTTLESTTIEERRRTARPTSLSTIHEATETSRPTSLSTIDEAAKSVRSSSLSTVSTSDAEEILRLNVCGHEFHAECLTGWFVFGKFSCPICRAVYFGSGAKEESAEQDGEIEVPAGSGPDARREEV